MIQSGAGSRQNQETNKEERTLCFQTDGAAYHKYHGEDNDPGGSGLVEWHSAGGFQQSRWRKLQSD